MRREFLFKLILVTAVLINLLGAAAASAAVSMDIPNVGCLIGDASQCPATVDKGNISQAIVRIYQFAVAIAGIMAAGMIVAGSLYISASAGSPDKQSEGKDMITSAVWGIVLLFGSYLILNTVNPRLIALEQPYVARCEYDAERNKTNAPCADIPDNFTSIEISHAKCTPESITGMVICPVDKNGNATQSRGCEPAKTVNEKYKEKLAACMETYKNSGSAFFIYRTNNSELPEVCHPLYKDFGKKEFYSPAVDDSINGWKKGMWNFCPPINV
ncbi:MAG: pilin [Candidatus Jorgensenbacteria bacterium]